MFRRSESKDVFVLKYPKTTVMSRIHTLRTVVLSLVYLRTEQSVLQYEAVCTAVCTLETDECPVFPLPTHTGRKTKTNKMVPISIREPNNPKSRMAAASSHTRHRKALTVVILPISNGGTMSRNV